ncbi:DUF2829 domain-containing protein [Xenorhabdus bovienii]|uniref:DUF2829 domain-containing protein n=1 Tax=Xenorhabdus bovienii TaxID=40576 RepID=UPI0023B32135|nr:DUF2829 domain-containing protein [Xenorhabdus bovienii]MDE9492674.1 DUF2829 domain-containing protein [Xenorhabdus bovienii]MDE9501201.1 DUF2829 domain-containing protein [Xenorhabdus bovienii]MDE9526380.1 DUF2829 domain-containing protein [Xenorhabdus bovienii]MDE9569808.1 DUF2829 domain-containing protein [Xenorhabdus bovienii]
MSEFIKPEHECPFDPKQYQCDCFIAPVGSFSWALIQLKLRKRVTRSAWVNCQGNNEMYLAITPRVNDLTVEKESAYAVDGVTVGTKYDYLTHIDLRNEHGNFVPWQPTQEDMMACDWKFFEEKVKPEEKPEPEQKNPKYNLVFDIARNTPSDQMLHTTVKAASDIIENDITKRGPLPAVWSYLGHDLGFHFDKNKHDSWFEELGNNTLIIVIDGKEYNLGKAKIVSPKDKSVYYEYGSSDSEKVIKLLKPKGPELRFDCTWYD